MRTAALIVLFASIPQVGMAGPLSRWGQKVEGILAAPAEKPAPAAAPSRRIGYQRVIKKERVAKSEFKGGSFVEVGQNLSRTVTETWGERIVKPRETVHVTAGARRNDGKDLNAELRGKLLALRARLEAATPTMRRAAGPLLAEIMRELPTATLKAGNASVVADGKTISVSASLGGLGNTDPGQVTIYVSHLPQGGTKGSITFLAHGEMSVSTKQQTITESAATNGVAQLKVVKWTTTEAKLRKFERALDGALSGSAGQTAEKSAAATADLMQRYEARLAATKDSTP